MIFAFSQGIAPFRPESGMGYQRMDLRLADGHELRDVLAFNAEEVELPDECANSKIEEVHLRPA